MSTIEQILNKLNVEYSKHATAWKVTYETFNASIVEKVTLKNKLTSCEKQKTLTDSVYINDIFTETEAIEDVLEFLHR